MNDINQFLGDLLLIDGLPGFERDVRNYIKKKIAPYVDEIKIDKLGNLIAIHKGTKKKVLLASHMDEVGFLVKNIRHDGFIQIEPVGGIDLSAFLCQRVFIKTFKAKIGGVITTLNTSSGDKNESQISAKEVIIDTGLSKRELIKKKVEVGSKISFNTSPLSLSGGNLICSKSLDDRIGCAILITLAKMLKKSKNEIYYIFSAREEMGLTGSSTFAYSLNPDYAIAVEVTDADDTSQDPSVCIGKGPVITIEDVDLVSDQELNNLIRKTARRHRIKYQLEINDKGTTDATNIEVSKEGIPCTAVCVPARNIHTTATIASLHDINSTVKLFNALLK